MATNSPVPLGEVFAGKYRVDRILGEGGMGVVVAAHHLELDQTVAIKFLLDGVAGSKEGSERFRREARAAAKIQSDHVVRVLDVGVLDSGERYMVMEYMHGQDLSDELKDHGTFSIPEATGFILEALDAIGHAHSVGIVHRDLKPANLFLARRSDGTARVKVLDFGISKTFGSASASELSLTKTSAWMGSPLYMSPEQMQSARDVDHRADIWSMGAIYYELLTGQPPYLAESLPQLCNLLLTADPLDVRSLRPDIPAELAEVITRCLARKVETRIQSAQELAQLILPFASSTAVRRSRLPVLALDRTEMGHTAASGLRGSAPSFDPATAPGLAPRPSFATISAETVTGHSASVPGKLASSKKLVVALALGAVLLGGVGFAVWSRSQDATQKDRDSMGFVPSQSDTSPEAPAVVEPKPTPEVPSAAPSTAPAAPATSEPAAPAPVGAQPKTNPPKTKPNGAKPAPAGEGDLSDFGGRR